MNNIENLKDLIIYQSQNNENISVEVLYDEENFWLTQKSMSKLFNVEVNTINYHLKEIFESHELEENRTIRKIRTVQNEGTRSVSRELAFYSLDAIIAVGYRVNSKEATDFRIWVTNTVNLMYALIQFAKERHGTKNLSNVNMRNIFLPNSHLKRLYGVTYEEIKERFPYDSEKNEQDDAYTITGLDIGEATYIEIGVEDADKAFGIVQQLTKENEKEVDDKW